MGKSITTLEMEVALMGYLNIRQNIIVTNISWGVHYSLHECDLISLTKTGYATEIEIKVSKYDLLKDKDKEHGHKHNHIKHLFFAVPKKLEEIALKEIPERAGLFVVDKQWTTVNYEHFNGDVGEWFYPVTQIRGCDPNKKAVKWTEEERFKLARLGTMRIYGIKEKLMKLKA